MLRALPTLSRVLQSDAAALARPASAQLAPLQRLLTGEGGAGPLATASTARTGSIRGVASESAWGKATPAAEPDSASGAPGPHELYPTHIRLSPAQRVSVAALSALGALARPARADLVAALGETTGSAALALMKQQMESTEEGRDLLRERPRVNNELLYGIAVGCPEGSFGKAYADFMEARRFEADERPPVRFVDDAELAYVVTRAREVHDFWHVLFDCHTNVFGELALKAVEAVQTGLPMAALSVMGGHLRLSAEKRSSLFGVYLPWALSSGTRCSPLMSIYYERHFHEDLEVLRRRWRITTAPKTKFMKGVESVVKPPA
uniref:Ubiquinone biosynthesis protein COQ4 homolog, mitochondrial n=1 Tax=Tetraselmis chuii TaxID=63592 RepID=A0A6U1E629_9CHLO|mmetsp:Transcript_15587/g.27625  ORF Transcript_15587/g.27625 Transcript_15587/m.27625 type:complete len:321 (+) Transcript_15587:169-1131(+)